MLSRKCTDAKLRKIFHREREREKERERERKRERTSKRGNKVGEIGKRQV